MLHTNVETDVFNDNKMAPLDVFIVKGLQNYSLSHLTAAGNYDYAAILQ